jgi:hypothetical protein
MRELYDEVNKPNNKIRLSATVMENSQIRKIREKSEKLAQSAEARELAAREGIDKIAPIPFEGKVSETAVETLLGKKFAELMREHNLVLHYSKQNEEKIGSFQVHYADSRHDGGDMLIIDSQGVHFSGHGPGSKALEFYNHFMKTLREGIVKDNILVMLKNRSPQSASFLFSHESKERKSAVTGNSVLYTGPLDEDFLQALKKI